MSWTAVRQWLHDLEEADVHLVPSDLGARAKERIWLDALERLTPEVLERAAAIEGQPYRTATFVAASTVLTAPIEWLALLLGRGTKVVLKHPRGRPGASALLVELARGRGLPLTATDARGAIEGAELVIAMGSDETMDAIRAALPPTTDALLFGHRFSAGWVERESPTAWGAVAEALWPFDSRGCMSPQVVFTPISLEVAVPALAAAMAEAQVRYPRGLIGAAEGASIRARGALARIVGAEERGQGWAVHGLTARHWHPEALPRCAAVVQVRDRAEAREILEPWSRWLSTVGDDGGESWFDARICPVRAMQHPEVDRVHDGVPVLTSTNRR